MPEGLWVSEWGHLGSSNQKQPGGGGDTDPRYQTLVIYVEIKSLISDERPYLLLSLSKSIHHLQPARPPRPHIRPKAPAKLSPRLAAMVVCTTIRRISLLGVVVAITDSTIPTDLDDLQRLKHTDRTHQSKYLRTPQMYFSSTNLSERRDSIDQPNVSQ